MQRQCTYCGAAFYIKPSRLLKDRGKYCSRACADAGKTQEARQRALDSINKTATCWLWTGSTRGRYGRIKVAASRYQSAHRFLWELTHGPIPPGLEVAHNCMAFGMPVDNPLCVNPAHMHLLTRAEHEAETTAKGQHPTGDRTPVRLYPERFIHMRGEGCHAAKLTEDQVRAIRARYAAGGITQWGLAREYGVYQSAISKILLRQKWRHLD